MPRDRRPPETMHEAWTDLAAAAREVRDAIVGALRIDRLVSRYPWTGITAYVLLRLIAAATLVLLAWQLVRPTDAL